MKRRRNLKALALLAESVTGLDRSEFVREDDEGAYIDLEEVRRACRVAALERVGEESDK